MLERRQIILGGRVRVIRMKPVTHKGKQVYGIQVLQTLGVASLVKPIDSYLDRSLNNTVQKSPNMTAHVLPAVLDLITL